LTDGGADAALAASLFHYKQLSVGQVKAYLHDHGVPVRLVTIGAS
jgi:cyclase